MASIFRGKKSERLSYLHTLKYFNIYDLNALTTKTLIEQQNMMNCHDFCRGLLLDKTCYLLKVYILKAPYEANKHIEHGEKKAVQYVWTENQLISQVGIFVPDDLKPSASSTFC